MSGFDDAAFFLELDKGGEASPEDQNRLRKDRRLHAGWSQFQALRALALEIAPSPSDRMVRSVLGQCRREQVGRQLSEIAGGDELARELLLGPSPKSRGAGPWVMGGLLAAALGLGWAVFHGDWAGLLASLHAKQNSGGAMGTLLGRQDPVPFEFPVQTPPAEAALAGPEDGQNNRDAGDADDVHNEAPVARQASRLLREHLHEAQARQEDSDDDQAEPKKAPASDADTADSDQNSAAVPDEAASSQAPPGSGSLPADTDEGDDAIAPAAAEVVTQPRVSTLRRGPTQAADLAAPAAPSATGQQNANVQTASAAPTAAPTALPASPSPLPSPAVAMAPVSPANASAMAIQPGMTLSSNSLIASANPTAGSAEEAVSGTSNAQPVDVAISMPERGAIDVRLFSPAGRSTQILAAGDFGPGVAHFSLEAKDDQNQRLASGTYYLRVMTPWFSRVEPIQIQ